MVHKMTATELARVNDDWYLVRVHAPSNIQGPKLSEEVWKCKEAAEAHAALMSGHYGVTCIEVIELKGTPITKYVRG